MQGSLTGWMRRRKPPLPSAESLLDRLGATDEMAQKLARYPVAAKGWHASWWKRLQRGVGEDGCVAARAAWLRSSEQQHRLTGCNGDAARCAYAAAGGAVAAYGPATSTDET